MNRKRHTARRDDTAASEAGGNGATVIPKPMDQEAKLISRLRSFTERLEAGENIPVTVVTVEQTPDGPLTTRRKSTLDDEWQRD